MDFCRNVSLSGEYMPEKAAPPADFSMQNGAYSSSSSLDDLFPIQNTERDVSLEWLSAFMEDCLSSTGNRIPVPTNPPPTQEIPKTAKPFGEKPHRAPPSLYLQEFSIPGKARTKRRRTPSTKTQPFMYSDPPLLQQAYWMADSELMVTKKMNTSSSNGEKEESGGEEEGKMVVVGYKDKVLDKSNNNGNMGQQQRQQQGRRCTHCLSQKTPQWRAGPLGPKTLCNACGVRFKSGRLLPEYRPAKSPTFVSYKHSNSHKKVMEMRMSVSTD